MALFFVWRGEVGRPGGALADWWGMKTVWFECWVGTFHLFPLVTASAYTYRKSPHGDEANAAILLGLQLTFAHWARLLSRWSRWHWSAESRVRLRARSVVLSWTQHLKDQFSLPHHWSSQTISKQSTCVRGGKLQALEFLNTVQVDYDLPKTRKAMATDNRDVFSCFFFVCVFFFWGGCWLVCSVFWTCGKVDAFSFKYYRKNASKE